MFASEQLSFIRWMEDNHSIDQDPVLWKHLTPRQQDMAEKLIEQGVLDTAFSLVDGKDEPSIWSAGQWVHYQWMRLNPASADVQRRFFTLHGVDDLLHYVILAATEPPLNIRIMQLMAQPGANPTFAVVPVATQATTVREAMEQLNKQPIHQSVAIF
mgnify:CR=1 FL=1